MAQSYVCKCCKSRKTNISFPEYTNYRKMPDGKRIPYSYKKRTCHDCLTKLAKERDLKRCGSEEARLEYRRTINLRRKCKTYKLTLEQLQSMMCEQNSKCKICDRHITFEVNAQRAEKACIDHCHATGKVRGLLCPNCNSALGHVNDQIEILEKMKDYVISYL